MTFVMDWTDVRPELFANLYAKGLTLSEIGDLHGLTKQRVGQLLKKAGINYSNGGRKALLDAMKSKKIADNLADLENKCMSVNGCSISEYRSANKLARSAYSQQRSSARRRGIEWRFTFWSWWLVWRDSGKFDSRGVSGFVMARNKDCGAYCPSNVQIKTSSENTKESYKNKPVRAGMVMIEINGVSKHLAAWCREFGISKSTVFAKRKAGMSLVDILVMAGKQTPARRFRGKK